MGLSPQRHVGSAHLRLRGTAACKCKGTFQDRIFPPPQKKTPKKQKTKLFLPHPPSTESLGPRTINTCSVPAQANWSVPAKAIPTQSPRATPSPQEELATGERGP